MSTNNVAFSDKHINLTLNKPFIHKLQLSDHLQNKSKSFHKFLNLTTN